MFSFISKLFNNQSSTQEYPIPQKLDDENFTPNDVSTPEEEDSIAEDFDLTQIPENFESLFKEEVENIWQDPEKFKNFPTEKKYLYYLLLKKKRAHSKSAKTLLEEIRSNFTLNKFQGLVTYLYCGSRSFLREFAENKGHIDLFVLLSCTQARIDFKCHQENDFQIINNALRGILGFTDVYVNIVTSLDKSLITVINSLSDDTVDTVLKILIIFLFEHEDDDHRFAMAKRILKYFRNLEKNGQNGWNIVASFIKGKNIQSQTKMKIVVSFFNALLLIFSKNSSLFMEWFKDVEKSGIFEAMRSNGEFFDKTIQSIEEQKQLHVHGINVKIMSTLSVDNSGEHLKILDPILNQLNDDNFLATEDPFFDLQRLNIQKKLGEGSFGVVYLTRCEEANESYAVKVTKISINEETKYSDDTLSIFREINLMSSFNYPTILKFIGYSPTNFEGQFYPTIIMEFCVNKTLKDIIELENKGLGPEGWDETKKLINIYGIAAGMKYLHEQNIIHRDLKSLNILMDDLLCPKIADFGLSKMTTIYEKSSSLNIQSMSHFKGTPSYMAPEILSGEPCSKKSDVYAFAFIVYEIKTGKTPFYNLNFPQLFKKVIDGERPELDDSVPSHYKDLIEKCWSQSPSERPTFENIVNELKNNHSFISDSVDESNFLDFIDFLDNYQSTFDLCQKHIIFDDFVKGKHGDTTLKKVYIDT